MGELAGVDTVPLTPKNVVALVAGTFGEGRPGEWTVEICIFLNGWDDHDSPNATTQDRASVGTFKVSAEQVRGWRTAERDD